MPSDKSTVATKADFVPKVVGKTDRDRSFSGVLAHDERSQQPRPEVHPEALNVLFNDGLVSLHKVLHLFTHSGLLKPPQCSKYSTCRSSFGGM